MEKRKVGTRKLATKAFFKVMLFTRYVLPPPTIGLQPWIESKSSKANRILKLLFDLAFWVWFAVYIGDKCVPKRAWVHEGAQRIDCKAPLVCFHQPIFWFVVWDLLIGVMWGTVFWFVSNSKRTGTSWPLQLMKVNSWTCFSSSSMPRTPWRLVSTLATPSWPQPLLSLKMERSIIHPSNFQQLIYYSFQ